MQNNIIRVLMVGDVVGQIGCAMFQKYVPKIKREFKVDAVIVNGENSYWQGKGITPGLVNFFKHNGANVITTGNHIWARKEIYSYLAENNDLLRPANFPSGCPGTGVTVVNINGTAIGVINIQGRVFMNQIIDCPFKSVETALTFLRSKTKTILVDIHAEATAEKAGIAFFLDGKVSAIVGTHTHVQTADERVLPKGTAFMTDLGMCGSLNSMIGVIPEPRIQNFLTQMPIKSEVDNSPPAILCGAIIEINSDTGKALKIERIRITDENIQVDTDNK